MVVLVTQLKKPWWEMFFKTPQVPSRLFDRKFRIITDGESTTASDIADQLPRPGSVGEDPEDLRRYGVAKTVKIQQHEHRTCWTAVVTYERLEDESEST